MTLFKTMILVQLFFSFSITMITHAIPTSELVYVTSFSSLKNDIDAGDVSQEIQDSLDRQTNIPLIDVGAMVFYSGNIIIDLMLNFFFAVPEMIFLLIDGIARLISINVLFQNELQAFASAVIVILYFLGLIQLITGLRAGRVIT